MKKRVLVLARDERLLREFLNRLAALTIPVPRRDRSHPAARVRLGRPPRAK